MSSLVDEILRSTNSTSEDSTSKRVVAVAWARVSTDMQEERGLSIPEQLRQIREHAAKHDIEIVEEYQEAASAFRRESQRVEFHRMLDRARSDKSVSAILVHDYSRFSRDSLLARTLIRELGQRGIKVISLNDIQIDPESVAGVYMEAITFAKNEAYSREVAFHTKKGCRANVQTRDPETGWCYKNGGQPLWGYRAERLVRGEHKARPIIKSIWVPDDRIVAGRPVYEWAQECLRMAASGATLDQLRDFCNERGIPAPRQQYWGHTTWNSILHPHCLLQYAGYGVWNVRGRNQRYNPPDEWVIVENAHEALISEDDVKAIAAARAKRRHQRFDHGYGRSRNSSFLLSGGLFKCTRCGSNLLGIRKTKTASYYVCGSQPHRRGLGCGPAVYVPQRDIEDEVVGGLQELLAVCTDPEGFTRKVNEELRLIWQKSTGHDPSAQHRLSDIESKIDNIRRSIEDGMPDGKWAYQRMRDLMDERDRLRESSVLVGPPPQIDSRAALVYRHETESVLAAGTPAERKQLIRAAVDQITMAPDTLEVEITYKIPKAIGEYSGSGGRI